MTSNKNTAMHIPLWAQIIFTGLIFAFICLHLIFPKWAIDSITVTLLVLIALVWVLPWVKTLKIPGGTEIEMREMVQSAEESLAKVDLPKIPRPPTNLVAVVDGQDENKPLLKQFFEQDPNLALAGLRIEIEKRLTTLGKRRKVQLSSLTGISKMIQVLKEQKALNPELAASLSEIVGVGNRAIHGADIESSVAKRALAVGEELLSVLDGLIHESETASK
jgi:hypothetical protein